MKPDIIAKVIYNFIEQSTLENYLKDYKLTRFWKFLVEKRGRDFELEVTRQLCKLIQISTAV